MPVPFRTQILRDCTVTDHVYISCNMCYIENALKQNHFSKTRAFLSVVVTVFSIQNTESFGKLIRSTLLPHFIRQWTHCAYE